jgi:hypothetical protein
LDRLDPLDLLALKESKVMLARQVHKVFRESKVFKVFKGQLDRQAHKAFRALLDPQAHRAFKGLSGLLDQQAQQAHKERQLT